MSALARRARGAWVLTAALALAYLAAACALASPVAGAFLALAALAWALASPGARRGLALALVLAAIAPVVLLALAFPEGGTQPFVGSAFYPALAGVLVVAAGSGWALAVDGTSFFVSAACLAGIHLPPREAQPRESFLYELRQGWSEVRSRTWLWTSVAYFGFFQMGVLAPFFVLGPFISRQSLGGPSSWALILSAAGIGSVVGGVVGLHFVPRRSLLAVFVFLPLWVPQLVLLALGAPAVAVAACALGGACSIALGNTFWYTTLQRHVPAHALARVSSYDWLGSLLFVPAGYALVGPVAEAIGVKTTLLASAACLLVATAVVGSTKSVRTLELRDADSRSDEAVAAVP